MRNGGHLMQKVMYLHGVPVHTDNLVTVNLTTVI